MSYFTDIDPIGESNGDTECRYCGNPSNGKTYCSKECREEDNN